MESIKSFPSRKALNDVINLGMMLTSALILWKALMCITGSESPAVVVLTGSMEPGFRRGDILFLNMNKDPIRAGEIVVFNVDGRDIPIVHRVIKVHEQRDSGKVNILTKGDANQVDDRSLYASGQLWLERHHVMGKAVGYLPYVGWATIILKEKPFIKRASTNRVSKVQIPVDPRKETQKPRDAKPSTTTSLVSSRYFTKANGNPQTPQGSSFPKYVPVNIRFPS